MSELKRVDEIKDDAIRAAEQFLDPAKASEKFEPNLRTIWRTYYFARLTEIEKAREAA